MELAVKNNTNTKNTEVNVNTNITVPKEVVTEAGTVKATVQNNNTWQSVVNSPWDLSILLFFIVSAFLYGFSLGRDRIIVILVSIYMSLAVVEALPNFVLNINFNQNFAFQITAFIAMFVVLFFFISRSAILRTIGSELSDGKWYQTIVFSILHVGLLISVTMSFLPAEIMNRFTPFTQRIFTGEWQRFAWIAAPILMMIIFGSRKQEED